MEFLIYYKDTDFKKEKPNRINTTYFYRVIFNSSWVYGYYSGTLADMKDYLRKYPDHELTWLKPVEIKGEVDGLE